jgi:hypothetical protein
VCEGCAPTVIAEGNVADRRGSFEANPLADAQLYIRCGSTPGYGPIGTDMENAFMRAVWRQAI